MAINTPHAIWAREKAQKVCPRVGLWYLFLSASPKHPRPGVPFWPLARCSSSLPAGRGQGGPWLVLRRRCCLRSRWGVSWRQRPPGKWETPDGRRVPQSGRSGRGFDLASLDSAYWMEPRAGHGSLHGWILPRESKELETREPPKTGSRPIQLHTPSKLSSTTHDVWWESAP